MNEYFVSFIVADRSLTLHTYIYDKRIEFGEVAHHHRIEVEQVCREILAVGQFDCRVGMCLIMRAVVGRHGIVDGIFGQLGMQFTPVTVGILTIVVVDAVSDVAGLLYLCDKASGTDGVNATRRQEEHIARRHFITLENVHDSVIAYPFHILLCVNLLGETGIEASSLRGVDYVPHFGLAKRIVAFHSQLVVGMHLDRQVITGVDKLNQQRESRAELVHYLLTEQLLAVSANQFVERLAFQVTVIDDGIVTLYMRKFPTFTDTFFNRCDALKWADV